MSREIKIGLLGITGRLGSAIGRAVLQTPGLRLSGAVVRSGSALDGLDVGVELTGEPCGTFASVSFEAGLAGADIVIDASLPELTASAANYLAKQGNIGFVSGVTGLDSDQMKTLESACEHIPVLHAGNFSLGVAMAERLVAMAASLPAADWDIEIEESHHRMKADAPSGTALMLGRAAANTRGVDLEANVDWARHGHTGARETGKIGFAVTRGGGIIGEHAVRFLSSEEEISISHRAFDRSVFARGAVTAAAWLKPESGLRAPGLYTMQDVVSGAA
ncbi:4-hydroxy-tetrahydrodipicolinate reductase [Maricaulis parjimensis]|uniref:4-hydroxy-tetrahydrodipicolinate reductase n=1 Tax=Maricaulis parjimensis TaxID=144023 RepID=UPI0019394FAF|nr:4-hydroxy-tetrahydrodipicolinate reductase [Maricaulis parjimensis]